MELEMPEPEMAHYIVECHTDGCGNKGHRIQIIATHNDPFIVCGPCGQQITDIAQL